MTHDVNREILAQRPLRHTLDMQARILFLYSLGTIELFESPTAETAGTADIACSRSYLVLNATYQSPHRYSNCWIV